MSDSENKDLNKEDPELGENQDKNHDDQDLENDDPDEDFILGFDPNNDVDKDDDGVVTLDKEAYEKLTKGVTNLQTTIRQKQHWRTKAQKVLDPIKSVNKSKSSTMSNPIEEKKETLPNNNNEENKAVVPPASFQPTTQNQRDVEKELDIIKLTNAHPYLASEADTIVTRARQLNISVEQVLQDPLFKPFVEQKAKEHRITSVSMGSNSPGSSVTNGEDKDWSTASKEDVLKKNQEVFRRGSK